MSRSTHIIPLQPRTKAMFFFVFCVGCSALAAGVRTYLTPAQAAAEQQEQAVQPAQASSRKTRRVESEIITITPRGFEPTQITRPAGEFILMVENRSGQLSDLRLAHEAGERLHEMRASREEPDWNELMDLHPGHYVLTDANHPAWVCHVTITAR